ncbi:MAG: rod shape-determining protein MreD [Burkholderiales bacterium]|nr:rod shape-determining protein MreD [Anaerolineae bacterium]
MGNYLSLPILVLAVVFQATFVPQVRILGGGPDLVFLFVLSWAINTTLEEGVTWAFVGGILQDLMSAAPIGASCIGLVLLVFGVNGLSRQLYRIGIFLLIGLVAAGSLLTQIVFMLVISLVGFQVRLLEDLAYVVLPTVAYNLVLILPVYWFVRRIQRSLNQNRRINL